MTAMIKRFRNLAGQLLGRRPSALQVAALCINPNTNQILLVTSRGSGRWIIPKGWPMPGRSTADAALQEAWEEAGVRGRISEVPLGYYTYSKHQGRGLTVPVNVQVYMVHVTELADRFPEAHERNREWFTPENAGRLLDEEGLVKLIKNNFTNHKNHADHPV